MEQSDEEWRLLDWVLGDEGIGAVTFANDPSRGRGLHSGRDLLTGDVAMLLPWKRVLTSSVAAARLEHYERARGSGIVPAGMENARQRFLSRHNCGELHRWTLEMALLVLSECRNPESSLRAWASLLPSRKGSVFASAVPAGPEAADLLFLGPRGLQALAVVDGKLAADVAAEQRWLRVAYDALLVPRVDDQGCGGGGGGGDQIVDGGDGSKVKKDTTGGGRFDTSKAGEASFLADSPPSDSAGGLVCCWAGCVRRAPPANPIPFCPFHRAPAVSLPSFAWAFVLVRSRAMELTNVDRVCGAAAEKVPPSFAAEAEAAAAAARATPLERSEQGVNSGGGAAGGGPAVTRCILPLVDMCNHSRCASAKLEACQKGVRLTCAQTHGQGQPLLLHYGEDDAAGLLRSFGFVPAPGECSLVFALPALPQDKVGNTNLTGKTQLRAKELLLACGYHQGDVEDEDHIIGSGGGGRPVLLFEVLSVAADPLPASLGHPAHNSSSSYCVTNIRVEVTSADAAEEGEASAKPSSSKEGCVSARRGATLQIRYEVGRAGGWSGDSGDPRKKTQERIKIRNKLPRLSLVLKRGENKGSLTKGEQEEKGGTDAAVRDNTIVLGLMIDLVAKSRILLKSMDDSIALTATPPSTAAAYERKEHCDGESTEKGGEGGEGEVFSKEEDAAATTLVVQYGELRRRSLREVLTDIEQPH